MLDLLTGLMDKVAGRAAYAEARWVALDTEELSVRSGQVDDVAASTSEGIGVRVRVGGGWGFAATGDLTARGAEAALALALAIAETQPAGPATPLAPVEPAPRALGLALRHRPTRAAPGGEALAAVRGRGRDARRRRIVRSVATARAWRERKALASTDGAACTQERVTVRRRAGRLRQRRHRAAGPLLPALPRRAGRGRGLGARPRASTWPGTRRAWPRRPSRC